MLGFHQQFAVVRKMPFERASAKHVLRYLGYHANSDANVKTVLDAGDVASYNGTGQTWVDPESGVMDFYLGATSGVTTDDPTFNGTAGRLSRNEFFQFDGGDEMREVTDFSADYPWHKDNATFTLIVIYYRPAANTGLRFPFLANHNQGTTDIGIVFQVETTSDRFHLDVHNGTATPASNNNADFTTVFDRFGYCALSVNEAVGTNGMFFYTDKGIDFDSSTYTSPSASNPSDGVPVIGRLGTAGTGRAANGDRIAMLIAFSTALPRGAAQAIYEGLRSRYGLSL